MTPLPLPVRSRFQTKFFSAALSAAMIALAVAGVLFATTMRSQIDARIEATLEAEARLAGELLGGGIQVTSVPELDAQADRIGALIGARVTFIAPDGRVVGDSAETLEGVAAMENHAQRPEVLLAGANGIGRSQRHSDTLKIDMLYVAVPVRHPAIAFVRVALPLTDVRHQLQTVLWTTLTALGVQTVLKTRELTDTGRFELPMSSTGFTMPRPRK
jgi:two-component system phosphate regulon sensor histidine kinase PhoR